MEELLAENNICGQTILQIVSTGNATIAELLRLKKYIPDLFRLETKEDQTKYAEIILDFSYFKISEAQEYKIENEPDLQELDEEMRDNHLELLNRFYLAFESIHQYIVELNAFINDLNEGVFIQQTIESILQDAEGKQLLCESLFLYGTMLLVVDLHIPGLIRERILVSYYRYSTQKSHGDSNIDEVCKLMRSTGFSNSANAKRVPHYPEDYFRRIPIDEGFIEMVIGRLRSDDIYNQITIYPLPEHRTTALANQAGMLYICLFFSPNTINNQTSRMREIVDKFFSDNWIISIYMGITVNLINSWEPYKAAKLALQNTTDSPNIKEISAKYSKLLDKHLVNSRNILKEGCLTEQMLLKNITKIINLIRECNVVLRWIMLHTSGTVTIENNLNCAKKIKQIYEQTLADLNFNEIYLFELLLNTSQLELKVREHLKLILTEKPKRWYGYRDRCTELIDQLIEIFDDQNNTTNKFFLNVEKNSNLKLWFCEIKKEILNLNCDTPSNINMSGNKITLLIQALDEVQEFHNLESNMQVKQHLVEVNQNLYHMINTSKVKENIAINLQFIGDLSYAWNIIDNYTTIMQESIKKQPSLVIKLRATFLKLSSALEIPLLRINQAKSDDLLSVSQYYSNELVNYVRKVVQIIPKTIFDILTKIIETQTQVIKEIPTRLEKDKMKEYSQLDERFIIAKLTYSISVFTEGILMMQTTLVGVIEINPKQLLEDGIRKELVKHVSDALHNGISFTNNNQPELETKLADLGKIMDGYRRSFEYIQDYLSIHGLKIFQEEVSRIINYNVERECNNFLRNKILDYQSIYQNPTIPIPVYQSNDKMSINFIGRLAREIIKYTDPKITIYLDITKSWYDYKSQKMLLNQKFFTKIINSIGIPGLYGLDRLYSFMIVTDLSKMLQTLQKNIIKEKTWCTVLDSITQELYPNKTVVVNPVKFFTNCTGRFKNIWPQTLDWILEIGQKQIIRQHIAYELNISCKFNSKNLESSLRTFNEALLYELKQIEMNRTGESDEKNTIDVALLDEANKYLEYTGLYNPLHKIYVVTKNSHYFSIFIFLFVIANLTKFKYSKNVSCIVAKKSSDMIDGNPLIYGIFTFLKQFHRNIMILFVNYMCQYVLSFIDNQLGVKNEIPIQAQLGLQFLEKFTKHAELSRDILARIIPEVILNQYEFLSQKV